MRERKNIKLRVDMNEDTKFKIIDRKPALDVFLELEMIELTKHNAYKVKNFAKHQNIKVKEQDSELDYIKDENTLVNNQGTIEDDIEAESQSMGKDINDEDKELNDEELCINTNQGERDKCNSDKIDKIKDGKFNEDMVILGMKDLIGEEVANIKEQKESGMEQVYNKLDNNLSNSKINKSQINDTKNVDKNIVVVDKRKKSNSKKNNNIVKDGFQDLKEKYVSETWEGFGCFKEEKGDKVIMEFDVS